VEDGNYIYNDDALCGNTEVANSCKPQIRTDCRPLTFSADISNC
jgi:hypothetical protein